MSNQELDTTFFALTFVAIIIGIAIVILFVVFATNKNKLINQQLRRDIEHQKRQHAAELQVLRGQMNPHFVHNSLNAIQYYIQRNEVETSENYLVKFSKLIRLFFDYSRRQHVTISEEINLLKLYLDIEKLRFEDKLSYNIKLDEAIDHDEQQLPAMILQPIVENAVNHGLFHKQGNGKILIHFKYIDDTKFEVIIEDDGIGINQTLKLSRQNQDKGESHSTDVIKERLELLSLSKQWETAYLIEDLSENKTVKEMTGTRVTLTFNQITPE